MKCTNSAAQWPNLLEFNISLIFQPDLRPEKCIRADKINHGKSYTVKIVVFYALVLFSRSKNSIKSRHLFKSLSFARNEWGGGAEAEEGKREMGEKVSFYRE